MLWLVSHWLGRWEKGTWGTCDVVHPNRHEPTNQGSCPLLLAMMNQLKDMDTLLPAENQVLLIYIVQIAPCTCQSY